jgi:hypothetical protein
LFFKELNKKTFEFYIQKEIKRSSFRPFQRRVKFAVRRRKKDERIVALNALSLSNIALADIRQVSNVAASFARKFE